MMNERIQGIHYATGEPVLITIVDGTIQTIRSDSNLEERQLPYIAPGLVDLQINGYRGIDFNTLPLTEKDVVHVTQMLWKEGVTSYYPTVITNSDEAIEEAVKVIAAACERNQLVSKSIAGIHVEGPFISSEDGPRGAHGREYVKAPDWELFQRWQEAAQGRIKMVTLSPEWLVLLNLSQNVRKAVLSSQLVIPQPRLNKYRKLSLLERACRRI